MGYRLNLDTPTTTGFWQPHSEGNAWNGGLPLKYHWGDGELLLRTSYICTEYVCMYASQTWTLLRDSGGNHVGSRSAKGSSRHAHLQVR